jgi:archaellum component FlaC
MNIEEQLKEMNNTLNLIGRNVASLHEKVDGHTNQFRTIKKSLQRTKLDFEDKLLSTKNELLDKLASKADIRDHELRIQSLESQVH